MDRRVVNAAPLIVVFCSGHMARHTQHAALPLSWTYGRGTERLTSPIRLPLWNSVCSMKRPVTRCITLPPLSLWHQRQMRPGPRLGGLLEYIVLYASVCCLLGTPLSLLCLLGSSAWAQAVRPFMLQNQSPLVQIFGLPPAEEALLPPQHHLGVRLGLTVSNHFTAEMDGGERLSLDGETVRFQVVLRYGLRSRLAVGLDLPVINHSGGIFDGFIEGWHRAFHLPQEGRPEAAQGRLQYRYRRNGIAQLNLNEPTAGLGDVSLSLGWQLYHAPTPQARLLTLQTGLKVPTGSSASLHGSGSTDGYLRLLGNDSATLARFRVPLAGAIGLLWLSQGEILAEQQRQAVIFGSVTIGWQPLPWLLPKIQFDWHSPFYGDSALRRLTSWSAQLTIGGSVRLPGMIFVDLGVVEDIVVGTAPDVGLHLAMRTVL